MKPAILSLLLLAIEMLLTACSADETEPMESRLSLAQAETLALSVIDAGLEPAVVFSGLFEARTLREDLESEGEWAAIGEPLWDEGRFGIAGKEHSLVWAIVLESDVEASACSRTGITGEATLGNPIERWLEGVFIDDKDGRTAGVRYYEDARHFQSLRALPTALVSVRETGAPIATPDLSAPLPVPSPRATVAIPAVGSPQDETTALGSVGRTLDEFPLRVGSRWTYRVRMRDDQVWAAAVVTHTVRSLVPAPDGDGLIASMEDAMRLSQVPQIELWNSVDVPNTAQSLVSPRGSWRIRITDEGLFDLDTEGPSQILSVGDGEVFEQPGVYPIEAWRALWLEDVVVPAGTFRNCRLLQWRPGNAGGTHRWFCPGIGFVKQDYCRTTNPSASAIWELVDHQP